MRLRYLLIFAPFILTLLACQLISNMLPLASPTRGNFSALLFCQDVTDDGECLGPSILFPAGTNQVWAYFTYRDMQDGRSWGRLWEHNGEVYYDARDQVWEDGESGWLAYSMSDDNNIPLGGEYSLSLFLDGEIVQQAIFRVEMPELGMASDQPTFGAVQFAPQITDDRIPVGPAVEFDAGATIIYSVFSYANMTANQWWGKEWYYNGEMVDSYQGEWGEGPASGITYLWYENPNGLAPGTYTLNLYLDKQAVQSASFEVLAAPVTTLEPGSPEDLIDADLLPAWQMLYQATDQYSFLHDVAQFALDHHIEIRMDESHSDSSAAYYSRKTDSCQPNYYPGKLYVYRGYWNKSSWEEVAATLAHELTHAYQHYTGNYRCPGCSVEMEYYANIAEMYTLIMLGRKDLYFQYDIFDADGKVDPNRIWYRLKKAYGPYCPDY